MATAELASAGAMGRLESSALMPSVRLRSGRANKFVPTDRFPFRVQSRL